MSRTTKIAAIAAAAVAATGTVALTASPAMAVNTGSFTATLNGTMVIDAGIPASCTSSVLKGTVLSGGVNATYTSATAGGCGVTVTPGALPWTGSSFSGTTVKINNFQMSAIGCVYGGTLTGTASATNFPFTATFTNQVVPKLSGSFICPSSAKITAKYDYKQP
ncbi:hypothetical protein BKA00_007469 [Actinomadura coerulea]|uniref:Uncharacterized protein n=1 Tax=Actinomadura coerulea TaxID=46159 RepID=A0A7X0G8N4_9ACTN|nr:hypothetical protein [Actinomadura coerulea]MBB6400555.1 hypothetical protein [Actinomadura coerulea]GGQ08095.1 hypothetical protein GCM10010187_25240 [Actinomadura coerulea]